MIRFEQEELDGLVEALRQQPGFITAAVVPAGSGEALIEVLRAELPELKIEIGAPGKRPTVLGARATELGKNRDEYLYLLRLDEPGHFDSEDQAVQFWRELNYQREALGAGTVRTCLLLSQETERGLALVADDLWDWTTIFRFPEAVRVSVRTPADSEALVWSETDGLPAPSTTDLAILRSQWQRARQARVPAATLTESYVVPLFLALPRSQDAEAIRLWEGDLDHGKTAARLPPESRLAVARKMMALARREALESRRQDLIQTALATATGAVALLKRKASENPQAYEPGLAAALSTSAKLHQDAGRFEVALRLTAECLERLKRLAKAQDEVDSVIEAHVGRQRALLYLQRVRAVSPDLSVLEQVESLQAMEDPALDTELRRNALGTALEISITQFDDRAHHANAGLFTAWILSDDSRLVGPRFEDVLAQDPISYCQAIEAFWQLRSHRPWEKLLVEPLIREWARDGPAGASIRETLVGWLLHFRRDEIAGDEQQRESEDQLRSWTALQRVAIRILGYRYQPELPRVFCRLLASLTELGEDQRHWHHRMMRYLGFMLRWSYQEPALEPLQQLATDPESSSLEKAAAKDLASTLWQTLLPESLRRESEAESTIREESFAEQLERGRRGLLRSFSPEELCTNGPRWGIVELAGDPEVPDPSPEDHQALEAGVRDLVRGRWSEDEVPVRVHTLWDPEFSARPKHRALRFQWLRACPSDKHIAQHTFAARTHGMLSEVESIGVELLALDRQLERALAVSLFAWHPEGDRWLEPLVEGDPSAWVRRHAEWALAVHSRDRLGRQIYREALAAASWLEQQARFEQLIPLLLPTFSLWPAWDKELSDLAEALPPRRRALLIDFRYFIAKKVQWKRIVGRDLEKYCRGDHVSTHLEPGEKLPPWLRDTIPR